MADTMRTRAPAVGWLGGKIVEGVRQGPPMPGPDPVQPNIIFGNSVDPASVSARTLERIRANAAAQGITQLRITSTQRDASGQARAMYDNLVRQGERSQRGLYDRNGDSVLDVAIAQRQLGASPEVAIAAMARRIEEIRAGDPTAFKHVSDPARLQAVDIGMKGLLGSGLPAARRDRLLSSFRSDKGISKVLGHGQGDPVIHIEIPQD
jgi:hypothetical protein